MLVEANALNTDRVFLTTASSAQTVTLTSTAGPITLGANIGNTTDDLTLIATAGDIVGGAGTATANNLTLTANADGIGVGTAVNTEAVVLRASAGTTIDIVEATAVQLGDGVAGVTSSGGDISIATTTGAITTGNSVTTTGGNGSILLVSGGIGGIALGHSLSTNGSGDVRLMTGGAITQSAGTIVTDALGVQAVSGVTLAQSGNNAATVAIWNQTSGNVSYRDTNDFVIDTVTTLGAFSTVDGISNLNGNVTLFAGSGTVMQVSGMNVTASGLELQGPGSYTLTNTGNDVGTIAGSTSGAVKYVDANVLTVGNVGGQLGFSGAASVQLRTVLGDLTVNEQITAGGLVTLEASQLGAAVTQGTSGTITAATLGVNSGGAITLDAATNDIGTSVAMRSAGADLAFHNAGGYTIDTVAADSPVFTTTVDGLSVGTNTITLTTDGGVVSQASGKNVQASNLALQGAADYTLTNTGNDVATIAGNTSGAVNYVDANVLTVGNVGGQLGFSGAASVQLRTVLGDLTVNEQINAGGGLVTLETSQLGAAVTQGASGVITALTLGVNSGGAITLDAATNDVGTSVAMFSAGADLAFHNAGSYTINTVAADSPVFTATVDGLNVGVNTITLTTDAGVVDQASGKNVLASNLALQGGAGYTLTNTGNDVGTIAGNTSGGVKYVDANVLTVGNVGGQLGFGGAASVQLRTVLGDLTVDEQITAGGLVTLQTSQLGAAVTQGANGVITAATLGVNSGGAITLDAATNDVGTSVAMFSAGGDLAFHNAGSYTINTVAADSPVFTTTVNGLSVGSNTINLTTDAGTVTQQAGMTVQASGLRLLGAGAYALTDSGNNVATIAASGTGAISYTDADNLEIGTVNGTVGITAAGNVQVITVGTGNLDVNAPVTTTVGSNGTVTINAAATLTLAAAGDIDADGAVSLTGAGAGGIHTGGNITTTGDSITFVSPTTLTGDVALISAGGAIAFNSSLTATNAGLDDLSITAGTGSVTVTGRLGATRLGGVTINSAGAAQFLDTTANQQAASLTVTSSTSTTYSGKLDLTGGVSLAAGAGNVSFLNGLNTGAASTLVNSGTLQIGDNLADSSSINTSLVHTAGPTVLAGAIASPTMTFGVTTLFDDTTLNATGSVNFNNTLSGQRALSISTTGATTFSDVVGGGGNALTTLSVNSDAGIAINGGAITTSGAQTYSDNASFDGATTLTSGSGGISFGGSLTGPVANADLTVGAGAGDFSVGGATTNVNNLNVTSATNVTFTGALSAANLDVTTTGNVAAVNVNNAISGTTTFTVGGNVDYKEAGSILLGAATVGGLATIEARNGGITTTGLFQADDGMTLAASDTSGGNTGTITVGAGGLQSSNAAIRLHAADDITVNGAINSNGGNIQFISGDANGINYASPLLAPFLVGREAAQDEFGALTINAVVDAGTGQIMVVAAGDAGTGPSFADVNQGPAGALRSSLLSVVTLKGPGGLGNPGANITLDNLPPDTMNTNSTVRLFTCAWLGCPDPLPAPPLPPVNTLSPSLISYSGGNIRYTDSSGVNLAGLGTVADFYLFTNGSFTLTPNPFSAGSVFVEASEDIVIDLGQPLLKISNDPNASLNFIAGRDIWYVNPSYSGKGYTIGTPGTPFANHLNFTAVRSIVLNNSLYQDAAHNLTIAANAEIHTPFQDKLPSGAGHVTLLGSYQVHTGGSATISGIDFSLLGYGNVRPGALPTDPPVLNDSFSDAPDGATVIARTLPEPAQVANPYGQELIAGSTLTLANTGVITVAAGTTTGSAADPMGNGARLQGGTVNIGQAGGANNPTLLYIQGGDNSVGALGNDPGVASKQADAIVRSTGDMSIYLRGVDPATVAGLGTMPLGGNYSLIVRGGTATANNSGAIPLNVGAQAVLQANRLTLETEGTILFQGGTAELETTNALAAANARLLVSDEKTITTRNGGSVLVVGGTANVNATDAGTGAPMTTADAPNSQAFAQIDPSKLTMTVDGILVLQGGTTTGPAGAVASARIDAGDEIKITVNGTGTYSYGSSGALGPASFFMIGGPDSGFFDSNNVDLAGSLAYPQAFPITVTLAGPFHRVTDTGLAGSVVQTGLTTFDDSLLSYIIFAANEETRAVRILRRFDEEDTGVAACR